MPKATALICATDLLARRSYGVQELLRKLKSKGYPPEECEDVVNKFAEKGILSDNSFVEQLCHEAERSGKGLRWLHNKMMQAGVESSSMESLLLDCDFDQDKELEILKNYFRRHFGGVDLSGQKEQASAVRHLQGRGFSVGNIFKVLRSAGADDLNEFSED